MKKYIYFVLVFCFLVVGFSNAGAQVVYGTYDTGGTTFLAVVDIATCTACNVFEVPSSPHAELTILPDGRIVLIGTLGNTHISVYTPPSSIPDNIPVNPPGFVFGSVYFNNLLYIFEAEGLYYFDPTNDQITFVGTWPAGFPTDMYFYELGGEIYGITFGIPSDIYQIDLNDPGNSTFVQTTNFSNLVSAATSVGNQVFISDAFWLNTYDPNTNSFQQECNYPAMGIEGFLGMTNLPPGLPPFPCLCVTDAGTVIVGLDEFCLPEDATVPYNNDATLDGDDLLQYILFSDLTDTLGSILVTSNTPDIAFDPATMQTGATYYLATIAGNDLNGNIDLNDDCLSISNASEVVWWPQPSVSFAAPNPDVCVGGCITLEVTLTGTPPFGLTGEILAGANVVGTFNENYLQNNGTLNACAPLGTPPGSLSVQAITLSDANCSCL